MRAATRITGAVRSPVAWPPLVPLPPVAGAWIVNWLEVAEPVLAALSTARTAAVCTPGLSPVSRSGLVHVEKGPPSRLHS